jgi:hypothetical protein
MTERKTDSEPREQDEELKLEKEKLQDLDVQKEQGEDVKGGRACAGTETRIC